MLFFLSSLWMVILMGGGPGGEIGPIFSHSPIIPGKIQAITAVVRGVFTVMLPVKRIGEQRCS